MGFLRGIARLVAMAITTSILYPAYLVFHDRRPAIVRRWHATLSSILGIRITIEGIPPSGAFLLVSNHLSYIDVTVLGGIVETLFVARADMSGWPLLGPLAASTGTIFIDRSLRRDAVRAAMVIETALRSGRAVVIFPEGTSTDGSSVLPFKSPLLEVAIRNGLPVHVAAIQYATPGVAWFDNAPFGPHAWGVLRTARIEARVRFGESITGTERKELAQQLWSAVNELADPPVVERTSA